MSDAASEPAKLRAALAGAEARADVAESELAQTRAVVSCSEAMIQELKLEIAKLRRDKYGISSERRARLIDQLELQLEELETAELALSNVPFLSRVLRSAFVRPRLSVSIWRCCRISSASTSSLDPDLPRARAFLIASRYSQSETGGISRFLYRASTYRPSSSSTQIIEISRGS